MKPHLLLWQDVLPTESRGFLGHNGFGPMNNGAAPAFMALVIEGGSVRLTSVFFGEERLATMEEAKARAEMLIRSWARTNGRNLVEYVLEDFRTLPDSRQYEPEKLIVPKDTIYAAESALKAGIGYTKSVAAMLNEIPVPTYLDDRMLDMLGTDIRNMEIALEAIKKAAASDRIG